VDVARGVYIAGGVIHCIGVGLLVGSAFSRERIFVLRPGYSRSTNPEVVLGLGDITIRSAF
jgi:hypothetical protein